MGILGQKSYFKKEKERIEGLIEELLLIQVLQFLPDQQLAERDEDEAWETIAINLNSFLFVESVKEKDTDFNAPTLTGSMVKEFYGRLQKEHKKNYGPGFGTIEDVKKRFSTKKEFILHELYLMQNIGIETTAKLAKERLEENFRIQFAKILQIDVLNGEGTTEGLDDETKGVLEQHKESHANLKLDIYERELIKKQKKIEMLLKDNKTLLELNHDLLDKH